LLGPVAHPLSLFFFAARKSTEPVYQLFLLITLAPRMSYPFWQDFTMWDPVSFVVIVLCKTAQYVLANLLVMMVVIMALSKR